MYPAIRRRRLGSLRPGRCQFRLFRLQPAAALDLLVRLERIKRALRRWDAWETNALLPEELQCPVVQPVLHREGLDGLQRLLTEELAWLDGRIASGE